MSPTELCTQCIVQTADKAHASEIANMLVNLMQETERHEPNPVIVRAAVDHVIESPTDQVLVAVDESGRTVGMLIVAGSEFSDSKNGLWRYVTSLHCSKTQRGNGVGSLLLNHAFRTECDQGCLGLRLLCHRDNHKAARWYKRRGFKQLPYLVFEKSC
jgi:GNAT superfamily N-acetyltransferase